LGKEKYYFGFIASLSAFPTLKCKTLFSGTSTFSPVFGFLALLGLLLFGLKLPKPLISIFSPLTNASFILSKTVILFL
jgi:hypothetical protein